MIELLLALVPNDPWFANWQKAYQDGAYRLNLTSAWAQSTGNGETVAVLNTGCALNHPDLKITVSWDAFTQGPLLGDVGNHGTMACGVAAATTNNGIGVAGAGFDAKLAVVNVWGNGVNDSKAIARGLDWCRDRGIRIAVVPAQMNYYASVQAEAAKRFYEWGGLLFTSAGNVLARSSWPDHPYAITVAMVDTYGVPKGTYGPSVDLCAPNAVYTTTPTGYGLMSGSSASAPMVAGVAALVWARNPFLSNVQVEQILKSTATDLGPAGWDEKTGWGLVNAAKAVGG